MGMKEIAVQTSFGFVQVYCSGNGPQPIVLLHGSGCDHAMLTWGKMMPLFDERYTVYAIDFLGYGKSDKPIDLQGEQFFETHIETVKQVVDHLNIQSFILAGLSMGGAIAIGFALKYQAYVKALLPVASWGISKKLPMHVLSYYYIHYTDWTVSQFKWIAKSRWMAKWFIHYTLFGDKQKVTSRLVDEVIETCQSPYAGLSMQQFQRSASTKTGAIPYYEHELAELQMPVIFVVGDKDPLVPYKAAITASKHAPYGSFYVMKGCKHWAIKERPHEFVELVHNVML